MHEQYARQAEQKLSQLPASERQRVTQNEDSLAKWIAQNIAGNVAYDVLKKAAMLVLSRGRRR